MTPLPDMTPLVLCADDYALSAGISRGILDLVEHGRLSAVSCMTVSDHWPEHAAWLKPFDGRVDIGLHLTLTELPLLGAVPALAPTPAGLGAVLLRGLGRRLPAAAVAPELERQLARFTAEFGRPPDFLDGHQHVHLLPGVREAVLALWQRHLRARGGYLRVCAEPAAALAGRGVAVAKALFLSALAQGLRRRARAVGAPANDSFRGVHDFGGAHPPEALFPRFFAGPGRAPLMMCHPARPGAEPAAVDSPTMARWREREYGYLMGPRCLDDLARAGVVLGRFPGRESGA